MEKDRKFRALAIAAICVAIVGVSVAYAALTASLTISGTATVSTENAWKIQWTAVGEPTKSAAVSFGDADAGKPKIGSGNQNITWTATFGAPKTNLTFTATFTNSGTIPAKLEPGTYVNATGDASSNFDYSVKIGADDISTKSGNILQPGKSVTVTVTVDFDKTGTLTDEQLEELNTKAATFTLNLPWTQATDTEVESGTKF